MSQGRRDMGIGALLAILMAASVQPAYSADDKAGVGTERKPRAADGVLREKAQAAVQKGLNWLKTHQRENGAWSNESYPALTALGLWAAAVSARPEMTATCSRAAAFVASFSQGDGGIYRPATGGRGSGGLSTYNTAICMTALHAYDRARFASVILKARKFMVGSQLQGDSPGAGGFGYDRAAKGPRDRADLSNTGWALMAMRVTQNTEDLRDHAAKAVDVDWASALKFIEKLQNTDRNDPENGGGFCYESGGERGGTTVNQAGAVALRAFGSMTYAGLESMIYAQVDQKDPRVRAAIDWAARHWSVEENPGMGSKGLFYYYTIMAKALSLAGGDTLQGAKGPAIPWRKDLMAKLVSLQQPDGSWANTDNTYWENDPALVTAYAVLTLEYALGK